MITRIKIILLEYEVANILLETGNGPLVINPPKRKIKSHEVAGIFSE